MNHIHVFGDSHVNVLELGYRALKEKDWPEGLSIDFYSRHGRNWFATVTTVTADHVEVQGSVVPDVQPVDHRLMLGSQNTFVFSSLFHSQSFFNDTVWTAYCPFRSYGAHPELIPVSDAVVVAAAAQHVRERVSFLLLIKGLGLRVLVPESPRPFPRYRHIPVDILLELDQQYRAYVRSVLEKAGVKFVPVPSETIDNQGFTREEYMRSDPTDMHHGNELFAAKMMQRIVNEAAG